MIYEIHAIYSATGYDDAQAFADELRGTERLIRADVVAPQGTASLDAQEA